MNEEELKAEALRDPKVGDVWKRKYQGQYFESRAYSEREIDEVHQGAQGTRIVYVGPDICCVDIAVQSFRRWARTAELVRRGK